MSRARSVAIAIAGFGAGYIAHHIWCPAFLN